MRFKKYKLIRNGEIFEFLDKLTPAPAPEAETAPARETGRVKTSEIVNGWIIETRELKRQRRARDVANFAGGLND